MAFLNITLVLQMFNSLTMGQRNYVETYLNLLREAAVTLQFEMFT